MQSEAAQHQDWGTLVAPVAWRTIDFISDLHLQADAPATARAWLSYLDRGDSDALFILGDLFEVWVGDDALQDTTKSDDPNAREHQFLIECCAALKAYSSHTPVFVMHGNRDFLLGNGFAQAAGSTLISDPTCLQFQGGRYLLTHGDAWCLEDRDYLNFRQEVRSAGWKDRFLSQPLAQRETIARDLRQRSEANKSRPGQVWADLDDAEARRWLQRTKATSLIHGHTHRPDQHALGQNLQRWVLSDWDAEATPPRAEVLRLDAAGQLQRISLM